MHKIFRYKLKLTVVSPLSIGAERAKLLSPYSDYLVSEDSQHLLYLNKNKLEETIAQDRALLDIYLAEISGLMDNQTRSTFNIGQFIQEKMGGDPATFTRTQVKNRGISKTARIQIQPIIKSAGRPYIPGSSLKGAIRTAILYDWLDETQEGARVLKQAYRDIESCYKLLKQQKELERKKREQKRLPEDEFRKLRELGKQLKYKIRNLERDILDENLLFGKLNQKHTGPSSQAIQLTDSDFFQPDHLGVYLAERIRLQPLNPKAQTRADKQSIPQPRECLEPESQTTFRINIHPDGIQGKVLDYLRQKGVANLLEIIRKFGLECMNQEIYLLESAHQMPDPEIRRSLLRFYKQLAQQAEKGSTFMRIGLGKTFYDNSLGMALLNYAEDEHEEGINAFRKFRELIFKVKPEQDLFPVTRTITTYKHFPMGWVKLEAS